MCNTDKYRLYTVMNLTWHKTYKHNVDFCPSNKVDAMEIKQSYLFRIAPYPCRLVFPSGKCLLFCNSSANIDVASKIEKKKKKKKKSQHRDIETWRQEKIDDCLYFNTF